MKITSLLLFFLVLSVEASRACICAPLSDDRLYYIYSNIQTATVHQIDVDSADSNLWTIRLSEVSSLKGNTTSNLVFISFQKSSCGISIEEGQSWVFFFHETDSIGRIDLNHCTPSRNMKSEPFDLDYLFQYRRFDYLSLPEDTFELYSQQIRYIIDSCLVGINPLHGKDTAVFLDYYISNEGVILIVQVKRVILLSNSSYRDIKYVEDIRTDEIRRRVIGTKVPVFTYYGHPLNVEVWHRCP